jgi:hypothetical protein
MESFDKVARNTNSNTHDDIHRILRGEMHHLSHARIEVYETCPKVEHTAIQSLSSSRGGDTLSAMSLTVNAISAV